MPIWVSAYWTKFLVFMGLAKDSQRPNWGAFMLLLGMVLIAMRWTPIPAAEGAPWFDFYFVNAKAMLTAAAGMVTQFENLVGIFIGVIGLRQMQAPSTSAPSFTKAVGESLVKIEAISNGHPAPADSAAPPAGG